MSHNQNIVRLLKDRQGPEIGSPQSSTDKEASTSTTSAVQATGTPGNGSQGIGQSPTVQAVDTGDNVFLIEDGKPQMLSWDAADNVQITLIEWLYYDGSNKPERLSELSGKDSGFHSITVATLQGDFWVSNPNYIEGK
jgi:hypothetical protein